MVPAEERHDIHVEVPGRGRCYGKALVVSTKTISNSYPSLWYASFLSTGASNMQPSMGERSSRVSQFECLRETEHLPDDAEQAVAAGWRSSGRRTIQVSSQPCGHTVIRRHVFRLYRYLFSADGKEERFIWIEKVNKVLTAIRDWIPTEKTYRPR